MFTRQISFALFFVLASVTGLWAGPADDLFKAGNDAYGNDDYATAITNYEKIVKDYASSPVVNDAKLRLGLSYLYSSKYAESVDIMTKLTEKGIPPDIRERALFYIGQAQLSLAGSLPADDKTRATKLGAAVTSFSDQLKEFPKSDLREDVYYNRALAQFFLGKYEDSEKDFVTLVAEFPSSLNKADYVFWQARTYGARATKALGDKNKPAAEAAAAKAKAIYAKITDADSLIVANDARFESAELDFYTSDKTEYPATIAEYSKVRRRDDLIPAQKAKIDALKVKYAAAAQANNRPLMDSIKMLRDREQSRLNDLMGRVDMAIKAAIRKSQCYVIMGKYDEARVLLRRLQGYVNDEGDKKDVQLQTVLSYAYQGQVEKANDGLDSYVKSFPGDKDADIISLQIGNTFMEAKEYQKAYEQYERSLKDFPKGRYADQATLAQASAMINLGQVDKAITILSDFVTKNPKSPSAPQAQYSLGAAQMALKKYDDASKNFRAVRDNPQAGDFASPAAFQLGLALFNLGQLDQALTELKAFLQKYPKENTAATAALYIGMALDSKKDPTAIQALEDIAVKYPEDPSAAFALNYVASIHKRANKIPEMIAAYEKVYKTFPKSKEATTARIAVATYQASQKKYDDAAKMYDEIIKGADPVAGGFASWAAGDMWFRASKEYGAYTRVTADEQKEIRRRLEGSEKAFATLLKQFPDAKESGRGLQGLLDLALLRVEGGLLTNEQVPKYFTDIGAQLDSPKTKARLQLLEAAVPYEQGRAEDAFAAYKKVLAAHPDVVFTPGDARRYGELLLDHKDADGAVALFTKLQGTTDPADAYAMAEVVNGLGTSYLAKKDFTQAKPFLEQLVKQYGWHPKAGAAKLGLGQIERTQKNLPAAKKYFSEVISSQKSSSEDKGRAMIEMGEIFADDPKSLVPGADKSQPNAAGYFIKADTFFGDALPEIGAEALWKAGQVYEKAGQPAEARKQYADIVKKYGKTSYAAKAAERVAAIPAAK